LLSGLDFEKREQFSEIFRASFESGFSMLLFSAALIAGAAALLTYKLVSEQTTHPAQAVSVKQSLLLSPDPGE
jgi:hypothetical protein